MEGNTLETIEKFLKKIRETRKAKGFPYENMAMELEMSPSTYNKLERWETTLSLERLLKIKEVLNLPLTELFELITGHTFNQDLKDQSIGNVNNLYHTTNEKFIASLQDEIIYLRAQLDKKQ